MFKDVANGTNGATLADQPTVKEWNNEFFKWVKRGQPLSFDIDRINHLHSHSKIMPRSPRVEFPGAVYHVISRGNYRKDLFVEKGAGEAFEKALFEAVEFAEWRLHAYVVMSNHYHLLLETPLGNLVNGMRWLQGVFGNRFNRFRNERGHVFQGRYKSLIVEPGPSLLRVANYIHLNPVRAGLADIDHLESHELSSFPKMLKRQVRTGLIRDVFLKEAGFADSVAGMKQYRTYLKLQDEADPEKQNDLHRELIRGWMVGSDEYRDQLKQRWAGVSKKSDWGGDAIWSLAEGRWQAVLEQALEDEGKTAKDIATAPKLSEWKIRISRLLRAKTDATTTWIAQKLNMGHASNISRYRKIMPKDRG